MYVETAVVKKISEGNSEQMKANTLCVVIKGIDCMCIN